MFRKITFVLACLCFGFVCCNNSTREKEQSAALFAGNWLSQSWLDSLDFYGMPSKVLHASCLELSVSLHADSLCLITGGIETRVFKMLQVKDSSFVIDNFPVAGKAEFRYDATRKLLRCRLADNTAIDFFRLEKKYAVKVLNGWLSGTMLFLNERQIADHYQLINEDGMPAGLVSINSYNEIAGLPAYTNYELCLSPSCFGNPPSDIIRLYDARGSDRYMYQWKNDTLCFFALVNISRDPRNPSFVPGQEILRLVKKQ